MLSRQNAISKWQEIRSKLKLRKRMCVTGLLMFSVITALAQNSIPFQKNKVDSKGRRQGKWCITFNANWNVTTNKDSTTYYRLLNYKDDKPQGLTSDYYFSGQKQFTARLVADRPKEIVEGKANWFHENGTLALEVNFVNGLKEGVEHGYYADGKKYSESFYKSGVVQEKITYYDEVGKISKIDFFENGEPVGLQKVWDKSMERYNKQSYEEAEGSLQDLYTAIKLQTNADDGNLAFVLNQIGLAQINANKADVALKTVDEMNRVRALQHIEKDSTYRDWLYEFIMPYKHAGKLDEIEGLLLKILSIQKEISGENNERYLTYWRLLGDYYRLQKRYREAEQVYLQCITLLKKEFPNQPDRYNNEIYILGNVYELQQNYAAAEKLYLGAIESFRAKKDTTGQFSDALAKLVDLYATQDKNLQGIPYAKELVSLQKIRKGRISADYNDAVTSLAKLYRESDQFDKAESLLVERAEILKTLHGADTSSLNGLMLDFALLYDEQKNYGKAESYYVRAIELVKLKKLTDESTLRTQAELQAYLGLLYAQQRNIIQAEIVLAAANETVGKLKDRNEFVIAQIYEKIGTAQFKIENYADAEQAYNEAAQIIGNVYGKNHHNYYVAVSNICVVYTVTNRPELTIKLLDGLLASISAEGKTSPTYISLLESKVLAHEILRQDSLVIAIRKEISDYYLNAYGENSQSYFSQLTKLTSNQITYGYFNEAENNLALLDKIATQREIKETDPLYYDNILVLKISLASSKKDYATACVYAKALVSIGRLVGKPKAGLGELALNSFANNQFKQADESYRTYIDLVIDEVRKTFPYLSDSQKVGFYNTEVDYHLDLYSYMAFVEPLNFKFGRDSAETKKANRESEKIRYIRHPNNEHVFNYQLITKGILFESSQKTKQTILESKDQNLIKLFNNWQAKKEEMNNIFLEPDSREKEEGKNRVHEEIKVLEKQLALKSSFFTQNNSQTYTWRDVQKKLKKDEALVEVLAISAGQKLNNAKYSDIYLAFVITPDTKDYPLCVRLGAGDSLEGRYARNYQNSIALKMADRHSYRKYWKPLADTLKGARKIFFAPDGIYHKININTLQNSETGKYVLEEKEISLISQARDFITRKESKPVSPLSIILFGAPHYNSLPLDNPSVSEEIKTSGKRKNKSNHRQDTTQRFFNGENIAELPGTLVEINNVADIAEDNKLQVQKFSGNDANESLLKSLDSPDVLHIATHGFFMNESVLAANGSEQNSRVFANFSNDDLKNPLRRSGLLFSYCQQAFSPEKNKVNLPEDGILTAEEAQNLHLDNTEMVVMSACETGLGEVKKGEGVYGLQRSFQTAGAKSVLMSLWKVSDQATQELMTNFYTEWFKLKDRRKAFRQAQLNLREKYPEPFYWGAFVLVGQ
jgi:CHAT domain-containing protein/antitoxin component YwqK of YwqJK toxin-antitoxin module